MNQDDLQKYLNTSVLCWLATVSAEGIPNVSPKEVFALHESGHLVIAHIASPQSIKNIQANAQVCVSMLDVFVQKGCKIKGHVRLVWPQEADFGYWAAPLLAITGTVFPVSAVMVVTITAVEAIVSPRYRLYPDTTEAQQVASALETYGVRQRLTEVSNVVGERE
jgi:uncharacterized protein